MLSKAKVGNWLYCKSIIIIIIIIIIIKQRNHDGWPFPFIYLLDLFFTIKIQYIFLLLTYFYFNTWIFLLDPIKIQEHIALGLLPAKPTGVTGSKLSIEEINRVHSTAFALRAKNCVCQIIKPKYVSLHCLDAISERKKDWPTWPNFYLSWWFAHIIIYLFLYHYLFAEIFWLRLSVDYTQNCLNKVC